APTGDHKLSGERKSAMTKHEMTAQILAAKTAKGATWEAIAKAVGLSEVFTTSACLGENALSGEEAGKVGALLGLSDAVTEALTRPAAKGEAALTVPREPLQYRFQEILYVYGGTLKALIEEKFGAGIMSAIDFRMSVEKLPDPKGDRVVVTMNGKFLPYQKW
ncbi:MAG: cyanase, partial [Planctomycetaceae bacterium]|nr:cyanase [Planctomycetaceae bacterium]